MELRINNKLLFFAFISLFGTLGFSQEVKVVNSDTKKGIEDVFIYNLTQTLNEITNKEGVVDISKFSDNDTLIFTHPSYNRFVVVKLEVQQIIKLKEKEVEIKTLEITASKIKEKAFETVSNIDHIDRKAVEFSNPQTSADLLELSGGVFVQKSQLGGGSPIIRGFEASRVLLVVDGVRLNNAIYRSGHLQNAITIDNAVLEKTDVIYGANSVIYGSDAIGGVVHYQTRAPQFSSFQDSVSKHSANAYVRYSSANQEKTAHVDFNLGFKRIASLTSITVSDFSDLRQGSRVNSDYPEFGIIREYADRINDVDVAIQKTNLEEQVGTGYRQADVLHKVSYKATKNLTLKLNTQYSTSSNVPRYDQLTDYTNGELRWAQWDYGPQNRLLTALSAEIKGGNKWFDNAEILTSFQKIDEDRITRRFNNDNRITREEDVYAYGFNADFVKKNGNQSELFYGVEGVFNKVASSAIAENIVTGALSPAITRYPNDGSKLGSYSAYLAYRNNFSEKTTLSLGARYNFSSLNLAFEDTTFITLPFDEVTLNNGALTGNIGVAYKPNENWKINVAFSTAFRSPNVDDVGKVFSSSNQFVIVPNEELTPEYAYNGEFGVTKSFLKQRIKINVIGFYTLLNNALVRDLFQLNGLDSLEFEGETLRVQANTNASRAVVFGSSVRLSAQIVKGLKLTSSLNYTFGENIEEDVPLGHIPPLYGRTDVVANYNWLTVSFYAKYQGWKRIEDFSPSGVDNEDKATVDGTPPWQTFNISSAIKINKWISVQAALENILDVHYRPFASGVSGPGRNFIFTLRANI